LKYKKKYEIVENWSNTGHYIKMNLNRFNGVNIDNFIIEFEKNNKFKIVIRKMSNLKMIILFTLLHIVLLDTQVFIQITIKKKKLLKTYFTEKNIKIKILMKYYYLRRKQRLN